MRVPILSLPLDKYRVYRLLICVLFANSHSDGELFVKQRNDWIINAEWPGIQFLNDCKKGRTII